MTVIVARHSLRLCPGDASVTRTSWDRSLRPGSLLIAKDVNHRITPDVLRGSYRRSVTLRSLADRENWWPQPWLNGPNGFFINASPQSTFEATRLRAY